MNTRRRFIQIAPLAGVALLAACSDKTASPAAPPAATAPPPAAPVAQTPAVPAVGASTTPVDVSEPAAIALGYVTDATKVDGAKFKTYAAGQACANCALFGAKAGDTSGPCPLFGGRPVAAAGWCSGYIKKAS